ncbi:MAG: type II toxin-antitoxin system RelE/ParE family toxin [Thermoanaerobaculia bacterium]|nr:type II toxin-antitoxin system RelE/ParE family toxin [Thermoanaerobaculia bacterium]
MKPVRIAPPAAEEFSEAVRWYEAKRTGLGSEFYDAVSSAVDLVSEHPEVGVGVESSRPLRQFRVDGFPYKIVYRERPEDLYIVALAHTSRRPGYWRQRL